MRKMQFFKVVVLALCLAFIAAPAMAKEVVPKSKMQDWMYKDMVDTDFVAKYAKMPKPEGVMIIDSRPYKGKYILGYIPTAVSIPDSKFDEMTDKLPKDKNTLLIFYCQGLKCKLSHKSAKKAVKLGYKNVKVYPYGYPGWMKSGRYGGIGLETVAEMMANGDPYMLIDARPTKKFLAGSIPSAISIPDSKWAKRTGLLPADKKNTKLIYFCGGYKCKLSHKSAIRAMGIGYKNVHVAEAGYPGWKKMFGASGAVEVKSGGEEGSIDIEQFKKIVAENPNSIMLIDVRDADEYAQGHIPSAVNMSVDMLEKKIKTLPADKPIVFVCTTGARSGEAYYMTLDMRPDIKKVYYLEAETDFHKDGSFTIHTPKK
ncbi:rhodanese-like domain-containing protein [Maridesulfovibrio salexigens]|uniref:Rhodanese domain protein n=1 Tax=Maridesulfovibrio salexigens (strain ATCC 14822 / DSM 2638 / NCIMB 8403 / VKM B-1763) TaxID=526222 RepID=C6BWW1_MARSD|nr:rhodanese-like domain-containing protein [Maridesulfovibrio salexigens]ACS78441.1 Rhodanese domain protein [Maridesulfovibrio salexigens DSM 2638]